MDSLVQIFDKMNSQTKNQITLITLGLLMPALVYLTIIFPKQMYNGDLLKILIMGISVNFTVVFILGLFSMLTRLIGYKKHLYFIEICSSNLKNRIESLKHSTMELKVKLDQSAILQNEGAIKKIEEEMTNIDKELNTIEKLQDKFTSYMEDLLNPYKYLSEVSLVYIIYILLICLYNVIFTIQINFSVDGILKNIYPFLIPYIFVSIYFNKYTMNPRYINLNDSLISNNIIIDQKPATLAYRARIKGKLDSLFRR